jgi:hypothetical protein
VSRARRARCWAYLLTVGLTYEFLCEAEFWSVGKRPQLSAVFGRMVDRLEPSVDQVRMELSMLEKNSR